MNGDPISREDRIPQAIGVTEAQLEVTSFYDTTFQGLIENLTEAAQWTHEAAISVETQQPTPGDLSLTEIRIALLPPEGDSYVTRHLIPTESLEDYCFGDFFYHTPRDAEPNPDFVETIKPSPENRRFLVLINTNAELQKQFIRGDLFLRLTNGSADEYGPLASFDDDERAILLA